MHRFYFAALLMLSLGLFFTVSADVTAQGDIGSFEYDGFDRTYNVRLPDDYDETISYPVIIVLHGAGGDGLDMQIGTQMDELAAQFEYIAVFPDGVERGWSFLDEEEMGRGDLYTDDVGFLGVLLDRVIADYSVDEGRIFLAGYSNGALLTIRAGCELSSRLSGIAIVAGMYSFELIEHCAGADLIPTMLVWGSDDDAFPVNGFVLARPNGTFRSSLSYAQTRSYFATRFGCGAEVQPRPVETRESIFPVLEERYVGCASGVPAVFYAIAGETHDWPARARFTFLDGQTIVNAEEAIFQFFNNIRRPDFPVPDRTPVVPEMTPEATAEPDADSGANTAPELTEEAE